MARSHILTPSWTSGATATSNGAATTDTDADKLLQIQTSRKFRSDSDTGIQITLDATEARSFDTIYLGAHNGVSTDTITITANASTGTLFSSPSFSYGPVSAVFTGNLDPFVERDIWIDVAATPNFRYIGIEIDASSNPDGYFEAGVVLVGLDFEPNLGMDLGWNFGWEDPSEQQRSLNGEAVVRAKRKYKKWSGTFPKQSQAEAAQWLAINSIYGSSIPVAAKWDPGTAGYEQYHVVYGHMQWPSGGGIQYVHSDGLYDVKFEIHEV